ncbi:MAG TPA: carboxylating nicotinate-nucleotide diphosphorylase [Clostridiales bacterium]|nr:carboxylating nicotinate-nucleotide diphosphorylase [Clostridiales bacterium]
MEYPYDELNDELIKGALREDIGSGDITTRATVSPAALARGKFIAKEEGVVCGLPILARVFELLDGDVLVTPKVGEGDAVQKGDVIAEISGPAAVILTGERVALNFLQLLSAIATRTRDAVEQVADTKAVITDTRKTVPGLRSLAKYAVRVGGGRNHRFHLTDGILIKDNHIVAAGGLCQAVTKAREAASHLLKIEVEAETFAQIEEALSCHADVIMLDNMSLEEMKKAVALINGRALVEASGNMGERDLKAVAATGVDLISVGALTHSIRAMDISLRFTLNGNL